MGSTAEESSERLAIEVWVDVVCPWCYLGEARLEAAIEASPRRSDIDLRVRTFRLNPDASDEVRPTLEYLAERFGKPVEEVRAMEEGMAQMAAAEGLAYAVDRPVGATLDMLRLVKFADEAGRGWDALTALQAEIFGGNPEAFSRETLLSVAEGLGLPIAATSEVLDGDRYAAEVRADHREAVELGATGVPFTVLGRRIGIPGAVSTEQYGQAIEAAWESAAAN